MAVYTREKGGSGWTPEATLYQQAQAGCKDSLNTLMQKHEGLVHRVVQQQWLCTLPYEAAIQEGRRGLWHAILGYDPGRGNTFSTYAYQAIMKYVWAGVKSETRRLRREVPRGVLALYYDQKGPDPAWLQDKEDIRQSLEALVERLPRRLCYIIIFYYGLKGEERQTFQAIGKQLGLSGEWVRQLHSAALVWLRQPAHSQELRHLLARHNQVQYELADELAQVWLRRRGGRNGRH
jgi:RNA polymerase sigma factor (sigma-70 family)